MKTTASALLGALLVLASGSGEPAKIYKWTDNQGNVTYSDSPRQGAQVLDLPTEPAGIIPAKRTPPPGRPPGPAYGTLILASPSEGQILQDPSGRVSVSLAVEPPLRVSQGDAIRLKLDGQTVEPRYTEGEVAIPDVPRGTHTLQAEVVNPAGTVLIASASVTFHVHEPSSQAPAGPDIYDPVYPGQPYPPIYKPVYPPQPYPPQGRPKPTGPR